jgi:non-homologous end joining protein Ku
MAQKNVSSINLTFSLLTTRGGLFNVKEAAPSREVKVSMVCPDCKDSLLDQVYLCKKGHKPSPKAPGIHPEGWTTKEIPDRAQVIAKKLVLVTADEIDATKAGIVDTGALEVEPKPAAQVEAATWPGATTYCFVPEKADSVYTAFLAMAADTTTAWIGVLNLRGNEKLYRLVSHEGTLRVMELLRPEETASFAALTPPALSASEEATIKALSEALTSDFDADAYSSTVLAAKAALLASKSGTGTPLASVTAITAPAATTSLSDALAASLALAKAKKAA